MEFDASQINRRLDPAKHCDVEMPLVVLSHTSTTLVRCGAGL